MSEEFRVKWSQVPGWMRAGLAISRVPKPLVTQGELSPNEMENLAKFGYMCLIVAALATAETYCFFRFAIGMKDVYAASLAAVWGILVFNIDRSLFRDTLDKARLRIGFIIVGTFVFSLGFSLLASQDPVINIITEKNRQLNEEIDKSNLANLKPYQDRYDAALKAQKELSQSLVVNDKTADALSSVATIQNQAIKDAGDTTQSGKKRYKAANNAIYTINTTLQRQGSAEKSLRQAAAANVKTAKEELEKQRKRYQDAYEKQRVPPDYSASNKTLALIRNYLDVGWVHICIVIIVAFLESFPLLMRFAYRDYDAVQLMIGLGNTPFKFFHARIKTIRDEIEKAKQEVADRKNSGQIDQGSSAPPAEDNPFKDAF